MNNIKQTVKNGFDSLGLALFTFMATNPLMTHADLGGRATKIATTAGTVGAAIVAVALIISLVKDGFQFAKGGGSVGIGKIIGKIVFLIVMIGVIVLVSNVEGIKGLGEDLAGKGQEIVEDTAGAL